MKLQGSFIRQLRLALLVGMPVAAWCFLPGVLPLRGQDRTGASARALGRPDPSRVMGSQACVKCHEQESLGLQAAKHHKAEERVRKFEGNTKKYCDALGITAAQLKSDAVCLKCHATTQLDEVGRVEVIGGVSCESCHGPAGGENGWLNPHAVYGVAGTTIEQETPQHREMRLKRCADAGMIRATDLEALAINCYECHLVDIPKLVAAGHPPGSTGFELVGWTAGEMRHNFHQNRSVNADAPTLWMKRTGRTAQERHRVKFVTGALVELEFSLRNRAKATNAADAAYAAQMGAKIAALNGKLAPISAAAPETAPVVAMVGPMLGRLFAVMPDDAKFYQEAADKVAAVTKVFLEKHDGSKLAAVDAMIATSPAKGTAFKP